MLRCFKNEQMTSKSIPQEKRVTKIMKRREENSSAVNGIKTPSFMSLRRYCMYDFVSQKLWVQIDDRSLNDDIFRKSQDLRNGHWELFILNLGH